MTASHKPLRMLISLLILYIIAASVNALMPDVFLVRKISTLFLFGLSVCLLLYFSEKIIDSSIRRKLMAVACMIMLLVVLRGAKYIAFEESERIARHLWYCYYVPLMLIPLISFHAAEDMGVGRKKRSILAVTGLIDLNTFLLLGLVITNDSHWKVFRFREGYQNWDAEYEREIGFFLVYLWLIFLMILFIAILFCKCRYSEYKRLIYVPLMPVIFGTVYLILYSAGRWIDYKGQLFGEFPETMCFTLAGVWLSMIWIRFVPSNEGYEKLFEASDLGAQIMDETGRMVYQSKDVLELDNILWDTDEAESITLGNIRLHRQKVRGGYIYWQDDITEINEIYRQLQEISEQLSEETQILKLENEMRKEKAQIEAKNRLYDGIASRVMQQSEKIAALCDSATSRPELFRKNMALIAVLGTYIKRYANLTLLAADQQKLPKGELLLALSESLKYVRSMGIATNLTPGQGTMKNEEVLFVYALFEGLLGQSLPGLQGVYINMSGDEIKMIFEGVSLDGETIVGAWKQEKKNRVTIETEDQSTYIRYLCETNETGSEEDKTKVHRQGMVGEVTKGTTENPDRKAGDHDAGI